MFYRGGGLGGRGRRGGWGSGGLAGLARAAGGACGSCGCVGRSGGPRSPGPDPPAPPGPGAHHGVLAADRAGAKLRGGRAARGGEVSRRARRLIVFSPWRARRGRAIGRKAKPQRPGGLSTLGQASGRAGGRAGGRARTMAKPACMMNTREPMEVRKKVLMPSCRPSRRAPRSPPSGWGVVLCARGGGGGAAGGGGGGDGTGRQLAEAGARARAPGVLAAREGAPAARRRGAAAPHPWRTRACRRRRGARRRRPQSPSS
jgi:hypothetical protein